MRGATLCHRSYCVRFCYSAGKFRIMGLQLKTFNSLKVGFSFSFMIGALAAIPNAVQAESQSLVLDRVLVTSDVDKLTTKDVSPSSMITAEELKGINFTNVEDAIANEPNLVLRKRYIGDPNGTLGIRSANMFQTTRSMVFADGLPLHYHLQTQYSGAPRWSIVAPNEVESVEVLYGPFSAEYSGNAMGGVVNIKTKVPTERKFTVEGGLFAQQYDRLDREDTLMGNRFFASYEDKIGDLAIFTSYNHLQNEGQPQTIYSLDSDSVPTGAVGGESGKSAYGEDVLNYGDSGVVDTTTDLFKIKTHYQGTDSEGDNYELRGSIAYEVRQNDTTDATSYLLNADGSTYYNSNFKHREQERESLLVGAGFTKELGADLFGILKGDWSAQGDVSKFAILKDERIGSDLSPSDPSYDGSGDIQEYKGTGWVTFDAKVGSQNVFGRDNMSLIAGVHLDHYQMQINKGDYDYEQGIELSNDPASGGDTKNSAIFMQYGWAFAENFETQLGLRYENWQAYNGFKGTDTSGEKESHDNRQESGFSPKFSIAWNFAQDWTTRYSLAKAIRFPIVEELYENQDNDDVQTIANADLSPEVGIHHNLSFIKNIDRGEIRVNVFYEEVQDTIFKQTATLTDVTGTQQQLNEFLNVDQVDTKGIEFSYNQQAFLLSDLDVRYNISYTDVVIAKNAGASDTEGNQFPRIPQWQNNLMLVHHTLHNLNLSTNIRYISDSYNSLDNSDEEDNVFGAIDAYTLIGAKANWQVNEQARLALGIDNITNEEVYVYHPYPSRTLYLEGGYQF
ncbi:MAG: TonB-dependent receptor [Oleispira sp.]|nr:TonB-dependent receptor [Oleispira sp.]